MRPFGMDDDDIELDYIFERDVVTSFAIVNRLQMTEYVPLENDAFWSSLNEGKIQAIPHTGLSCQTKQHRPLRHVRSYRPVNKDDIEEGHTRCAAMMRRWRGYE
ncbi:unnamed protein product [Toxocara canis]|nr:unnamed protein product [Toxocara canis]